ncbi:ketosteroid isomerase-like protein [Sphingosinicella soli]|uniref:Ketosteroid isomerase-like protein n=1 Tax=Sphingosinicella soli TaxID=333708 RepID=A0A7W7B215_9SPHN|nr:ketosteroid isomerase-like protein [Sphingosinicella soli]
MTTVADSTLTIEDRLAAGDVVRRFFWLVDHGRAAETAALFARDASLTFGPGSPRPGTIASADIGPAMVARQAQLNVTTRHVLTEAQTAVNGDGSIAISSLLTLFRSEDEGRDSYPVSVADIEDVLVREDGAWRIKTRTISPVFNRA